MSLWGFYARSPSERATLILERLLDLGEQRIRHMDETGIDKAILALTAPGAQALWDVDEARGVAQRANDYLAEHVAAHPTRYVGMTTVAPQDPDWSAREIVRGARQLGFKGVQINSHTHGEYLDHPKFDPIFRALADTGQPLYIHPQTPPDAMIGPMLEAGLDGAIFGFGVEMGLHLLRLIVSGIFDRYPDLQIMVGHMGEALPFWIYRIDYMHQASVRAQRYERHEAAEEDHHRIPAQQRADHHQRRGLGAGDQVHAAGGGRGSRHVRDGLSVPVPRRGSAHARHARHPAREQEEADADQRRALVQAVSRTPLTHTAGYALALVALANAISLLDRNILAILAPRIKHDLDIGDAEMGLLYGTVFALFYALFSLPLGRLADGWVRTRLLAIALAFWSLATGARGRRARLRGCSPCRAWASASARARRSRPASRWSSTTMPSRAAASRPR